MRLQGRFEIKGRQSMLQFKSKNSLLAEFLLAMQSAAFVQLKIGVGSLLYSVYECSANLNNKKKYLHRNIQNNV
jgi:hypothetical protein